MNHDDQFQKLKTNLQIAANSYNQLTSKSVIFHSEQFTKQKTYVARFYIQNFLHLTGIKTSLTTEEFFAKCTSGTIEQVDIKNFPEEYRTKINTKVKNLLTVNSYFSQELDVQEDFKKNTVSCALATTDGIKTIGFANTKPVMRPKTIMDKNRLDLSKPILKIKPKTISLRKKDHV